MNDMRRLMNLFEDIDFDLDEASEDDFEIMSQPSDTCPMIDAVIRELRDAVKSVDSAETTLRRATRDSENIDISEVEDAFYDVGQAESSLYSLEEDLEKIRAHVSNIREWGQDWKNLAKHLHSELQDANQRRAA